MPFRDADAFAFQVLGLVDPGVDVDAGARVAKLAIDKSRNTDEWKITARLAGYEAAKGHFGGVEFMMHAHAPVHLRRPVDGDEIDLHALGAHEAVFERAYDVIVAAAEVEG